MYGLYTKCKQTKGAYYDGHELDDVVQCRGEILKKMIKVGFLNPDEALTPEAQRAFPYDFPLPSNEVRENTVLGRSGATCYIRILATMALAL